MADEMDHEGPGAGAGASALRSSDAEGPVLQYLRAMEDRMSQRMTSWEGHL